MSKYLKVKILETTEGSLLTRRRYRGGHTQHHRNAHRMPSRRLASVVWPSLESCSAQSMDESKFLSDARHEYFGDKIDEAHIVIIWHGICTQLLPFRYTEDKMLFITI